MRLCPKYTRAKEEGRQRFGSLISTLLMHCCRSRRLVPATSGDELFRVLKMKEICPRGNNKVVILYFLIRDKCLLFMLELY